MYLKLVLRNLNSHHQGVSKDAAAAESQISGPQQKQRKKTHHGYLLYKYNQQRCRLRSRFAQSTRRAIFGSCRALTKAAEPSSMSPPSGALRAPGA